MYCKKCGKKLADDDMFCSGCGTRVNDQDEEEIPVREFNLPDFDEPKEEAKASTFHVTGLNWDLDGFPESAKEVSGDIDFNWSSVMEERDRLKQEDDKNEPAPISEDDLFGSIKAENTYKGGSTDFDWNTGSTIKVEKVYDFNKDKNTLGKVDVSEYYYDNQSQDEAVTEEDIQQDLDVKNLETEESPVSRYTDKDISAAMAEGIAAAQSQQNNKSIDKFYTFNKKNEEFQALLDQEYERLRARIKEEDEAEAVLAAKQEKLDQARENWDKAPIEEPEEQVQEVPEPVETEAEAPKEEELNSEPAAEETETEASSDSEEKEPVAVPEDNKESQVEEEPAEAPNDGETPKESDMDAEAASASEDVTPSEEASKEAVGVKEESQPASAEVKEADELAEEEDSEGKSEIETEAETAKEDAADEGKTAAAENNAAAADFDEKKTEARDDAEEAEDKKEAEPVEESESKEPKKAEDETTPSDDSSETAEESSEKKSKPRYADIFDDDDDDDNDASNKKEGKGKIIFLDIVIIILAIIVVCSAIMVFAPDSAASTKLRHGISYVSSLISGDSGDDQSSGNSSSSAEPEYTISDAISSNLGKNKSIDEVDFDSALLFDESRDYGYQSVASMETLAGDTMITISGSETRAMDEVVATVISYYSCLLDKENEDSEEVLDYIDEDSQLYSQVSAIVGGGTKHSIAKLQIGEIKTDGTDYYVLVRAAEYTEDNSEQSVTVRVMKLSVVDGNMKIEEIKDVA